MFAAASLALVANSLCRGWKKRMIQKSGLQIGHSERLVCRTFWRSPRTMEITVPDTIRPYGNVMREPGQFSEGPSPALAVQIPNIVSVVAGEAGLRAGQSIVF